MSLKTKIEKRLKKDDIPATITINIKWRKKSKYAHVDIKPENVYPDYIKQILETVLKNVEMLCHEEEINDKGPSYIS